MKKLSLILGLILLYGCKDSKDLFPVLDDLVANYRVDDAIRLEVSSDKIALNPQARREQALLVTWEPLKDIEAHYPVKYLFKMDLTENNFTTSIPAMEMPEGVFFKTYTHDELESLIRTHWKRVETGNISISVRVIAQVSSEEKYITPLYSTLDVLLTPYQITSSPLFIAGSSVAGGNMIEMQEVVSGEIYSWRGKLYPGTFKIATVMDQAYPAYGRGEGNTMVLMEGEEDLGEDFVIVEEGIYSFILDRINNRMDVQAVPYLNMYFGGSGSPTGWNNPPLMEWDTFQPHICTITTTLTPATVSGSGAFSGGELKFSTEPSFPGAGVVQLRPWKPDASIVTDLDVMANDRRDWKWRVRPGEGGRYLIKLDVKSMKVQFIKID